MSALILWMDSHEAKLFHLESERIHVEKVQYHGHQHKSESLGRNHTKDQTDESKFFQQLCEKLKSVEAQQILLMGPSLGATHFSKHLENNSKDLFKKIISVEKVANMPDSEILSVGRKHLQKYYLFNAV